MAYAWISLNPLLMIIYLFLSVDKRSTFRRAWFSYEICPEDTKITICNDGIALSKSATAAISHVFFSKYSKVLTIYWHDKKRTIWYLFIQISMKTVLWHDFNMMYEQLLVRCTIVSKPILIYMVNTNYLHFQSSQGETPVTKAINSCTILDCSISKVSWIYTGLTTHVPSTFTWEVVWEGYLWDLFFYALLKSFTIARL